MAVIKSKQLARLSVKSSESPAPSPDSPESYAKPFCDYLTANPTVFHVIEDAERVLNENGFVKLKESDPSWNCGLNQKYYVVRNGSSIIAFKTGSERPADTGIAMIATHADSLAVRLKPVSRLPTNGGYVQLGVAPYSGALNSTWWDRDLGIGGRVIVKDPQTGEISSKTVMLDRPIAHVPTLAPHFGKGAIGPFNQETQMVPVIGTFNPSDKHANNDDDDCPKRVDLGKVGSFAETQPRDLVKSVAEKLDIVDYDNILSWELELFDFQPAQIGGLNNDFIFGGRLDDKLCSWSALQALIESIKTGNTPHMRLVSFFDDEEVGSLLKQGANSNFLQIVLERVIESLNWTRNPLPVNSNNYGASMGKSFLVSADVTHAFNPNFESQYLSNHSPQLNAGVAISAAPSGTMATDAASTAFITECVTRANSELLDRQTHINMFMRQSIADARSALIPIGVQIFQSRNDVRSGGTVGPMLSSKLGVKAIDAGIPQLSMHSIRAMTGVKDPGLGVAFYKAFYDYFSDVQEKFSIVD